MVALSNSAGNVVESYSYDVFGRPGTTSSVGNPYMFTGRRYDTETGLYYYRFRYYSTLLGRFLQTDPLSMLLQTISTSQAARENAFSKYPYISPRMVDRFLRTDPIGRFLRNEPKGRLLQTMPYGFYVDLNLYTYCGNNPVNLIDPMGELWSWAAVGIGSGFGAIGGFVGGLVYEGIHAIGEGEFSWGNVGKATAAGAVGGAAVGAVVGAATGDPSALAVGGSYAIGAVSWGAGGAATGAVAALLEDDDTKK